MCLTSFLLISGMGADPKRILFPTSRTEVCVATAAARHSEGFMLKMEVDGLRLEQFSGDENERVTIY